MPWRYTICIAQYLYTCRGDLIENFGKTIAQKCKKSTSGWRASKFRGKPSRGPFLESPGNFTGPKSNIQIEI